jgi:hypothetical protein
MEVEVEELNALRSPFGYILATMNVDLDDSPSSGGCPRLDRSYLGLADGPLGPQVARSQHSDQVREHQLQARQGIRGLCGIEIVHLPILDPVRDGQESGVRPSIDAPPLLIL